MTDPVPTDPVPTDPVPRAPAPPDSASSGPTLRPVATGRYRDFLPAGEGGMGIVYWALDTELNRQVAFKVMRPDPGAAGAAGVTPPAPLGLRSPPHGADPAFDALKARFLQEAWVTGGLEHPGIVPVYELGRTEQGVPFYTMRYVRGGRTLATAIREAHARTPPAWPGLLEPFLRLCDTLGYAHARGVLHRDVKPENVALGQYGEVVLLDWGLARLHAAPGPGASLWQSQVVEQRAEAGLSTSAAAVGTPGYMPPEALLPDLPPVDVRGDVFSLGVVLHEVLTGVRPFPCRTLREYAEALAGRPAPDPRALAPEVPEALARLCMAALARAPDERLASAQALAAGIRSFEASARMEQETAGWLGEARAALAAAAGLTGAARLRQLDAAAAATARVAARHPGHREALALQAEVERNREQALEERARLERRRILRRSATVAGALLLVMAAGAALLIEARRRDAVDARAQAVATQRRAEDVVGFLLGDLLEGLQPLGRQDLLAQVAERTRAYYDALPEGELSEDDQDHRITALLNLGDVLRARGDLAGSEAAYRRALAVAEALRATAPEEIERRFRCAQAQARVAGVLHERGERTRAYALLEGHLAEMERLVASRPSDARLVEALGQAHTGFAEARLRQDDAAGARRHVRLAAEVCARAAALPPPSARRRERSVRARLAWTGWIEEPEAAVAEARAALADAQALRAADPGDTRGQDLVAEAQGRLVGLLGRAKQPEAAAQAYGEARVARERLCELDPGHAGWAEALVRLDLRRGAALVDARAFEEALPVLEAAHRGATALVRRDAGSAVWQHMVVDVCDRLGQRGENLRDWTGAMRWRREAIAAARALVERDPANAVWRYILGHSLCVLGNEARVVAEHATAVASLTEGLPLVLPTLDAAPDRAWFAAQWAEALAACSEALGLNAEARAGWRTCVGLTRRALTLPDAPAPAPRALAHRLEQLARALEPGSPEALQASAEALRAWEGWAQGHAEDAEAQAALTRLRGAGGGPR